MKPIVLVRGGLGDAIMTIPAIVAANEINGDKARPPDLLVQGLRVKGVLPLFKRQVWCGQVFDQARDVPPGCYTDLIGHWRGTPDLPGVRIHVPTAAKGHISDRLVGLARGLGYAGPTPLPDLHVPIEPRGRMVCVAPETSGYSWKRWPAQRWSELIQALVGQHYHVIVLGMLRGRAAAGVTDMRGRTSLEQVADIMSRAAAVIGVDSGLLHLAGATGTPTIGLYGPTDPKLCGPRGLKATILTPDIDCSPCWRQPTGKCICAKLPLTAQAQPKGDTMPWTACMEAITVAQVLQALP